MNTPSDATARDAAAPPSGVEDARGGGLDAPRSTWQLRPRHEALALALACGVFVLLAALEAARQTYPFFDDVAYLQLGHQVRALGGPLGLLRALLTGHFAESNRHPLYLALLSLVARTAPRYHRDAQALTIALGVAALLCCWWTARRHIGRAPAAALALLLAVSRTFVSCSAREGCEPLLVAVWALAIGAVLDGVAPPGRRRRAAWLRAGLWSGVAYLTKGTGLFLPTSLALAFLLQERLRAVVDRRAWAYAAGFVAAASPLFVRNVRMFGSPFYNYNLQFFWIDYLQDYAEVTAPGAKEQLHQTFLQYVHHLTPGSLAYRLGRCIAESLFVIADSMAPVAGSPGSALHIVALLAGAYAAYVAARRVWRMERGLGRTFLLVHAGWTLAFLFVFSVTGTNTRYLLPLAATVLAPALATRIVEDVRAAGGIRRSRWGVRAAAVAGAAVLAALALPPPTLRKPGMDEVRDFVVAHLRPGDVYAVDARTHLQPIWLAPDAKQVIVSASWREKPLPEPVLIDYLRRERVRYVVLDASSEAHMAKEGDPAGRRYLFYDRLPLGPDGSLPLAGFPPGFTLVYADPASPRRWLVLETPWAAERNASRGAVH